MRNKVPVTVSVTHHIYCEVPVLKNYTHSDLEEAARHKLRKALETMEDVGFTEDEFEVIQD